jgi:hypothetical protein
VTGPARRSMGEIRIEDETACFMMTVAQYIAAIQAVFDAAEFDASFQQHPSGHYVCAYNAAQVVAQKSGTSNIQFLSSDSTFNKSDDLSNPTQINPIADAMMAYCSSQPH